MLEKRNTTFRLLAAQVMNPLTGKHRGPRSGDPTTVAYADSQPQGNQISALAPGKGTTPVSSTTENTSNRHGSGKRIGNCVEKL